jgi:hypothetical protein
VGVLFRRGPSKWVRLIKWNVSDDTFEFGQWFHGRIYERRCDLSPDGRLLIYFVSKFSKSTLADQPGIIESVKAWVTGDTTKVNDHYTYAWTAISKPPWLTALALWPKGDCYAGGGLFEDGSTVHLDHPSWQSTPHPRHQPVGLKVRAGAVPGGEDEPIYSSRLLRDGWKLERKGRFVSAGPFRVIAERTKVNVRRSPCGMYELLMITKGYDFKACGGPYLPDFAVRSVSDGGIRELGPATWADWDHRGRVVLARDGCLFQCALYGDDGVEPHLIHDFNDDRPRPIESPPEASSWD